MYLSSNRFQSKAACVVYADFECLTVPTGNISGDYGSINYQEHKPSAAGYKVVSVIPELKKAYTDHHGPDSVEWFLDQMLQLEDRYTAIIEDDQRLVMTETDLVEFQKADYCHICGQGFQWDSEKHQALDKVCVIILSIIFTCEH